MRSNLKEIVESHIKDAGNVDEGQRRFAKQMVEAIRQGDDKGRKIGFEGTGTAYQVSIRDIFNATVGVTHPDLDYESASAKDLSEAVGAGQMPNITGELIHSSIIPAMEYSLAGIDQMVFEDNSARPNYEYVAGLTAATLPARVRERMPFPSTEVLEKLARIEMAKFGEIIELTKELVLGDQTGKVVARARAVGDKLGLVRHRLIVQTIIDAARTDLEEATSTAFYLDGSARTVYATTHTTVDSQTNDNTDTNVPSTDNLDTAYGYFGMVTDEKGDYIVCQPKFTLSRPVLHQTLWNLFNSPTAPDTANRAVNFYANVGGIGLVPRVMVSPYVASNTAWYMGDFAKEIIWLWGWRPQTLAEGANSTAAFERDIVQRFRFDFKAGCGRLDYRYSYRGNT